MRRSRFKRAKYADVRGKIDVVTNWIKDEVDVVVDGGPATVVRTVSLGDELDGVGRSERNVNEGYVVTSNVWAASILSASPS